MAVRFRVALGLAASGIIGLALVAAPAHVGAANACKTDATDGCERDNVPCDPPKGGKCVTIKTPVPLSGPKLSCECRVPKSRTLITEPPDPCSTAAGREQLLKRGGEQALVARCGHSTPAGHSNLPPPGHVHPLNPQPLPPG